MTSRRLILIRHSKAEQGSPDIARPLSARGIADSAVLGEWLAAAGLVPNRVVVSTGRRAAQTWHGAAPALTGAPEAEVDARIYDNSVADLLAVVHDTPDAIDVLALVGHNPSMSELAYRLDDGTGDSDARETLARAFPTSCVAVFAVPSGWDAVDLGSGVLLSVSVPRA